MGAREQRAAIGQSLTRHRGLWFALTGVAMMAVLAVRHSPEAMLDRQVQEEAEEAMAWALVLERAHPTHDFSGLDLSRAMTQGWVPAAMLRAEGWPVRTRWGTEIDLAAHSIRSPADGFVLRYRRLPATVCAPLAHALGRSAHGVRVNDRDVMGLDGVDLDEASTACAGEPTLEASFHADLFPGTALRR